MIRFLAFVVGALMLLQSAVANAATIPLGNLSAGSNPLLGGFFSGTPNTLTTLVDYSFGLSAPANVAATGIALDFGPFDFKNLGATLFSGDPATCGACMITSANGPISFALSAANLAASTTYFLRVSGTFGPTGFGLFGGVLAVTAVPIPSALLLFGSAIAGAAAFSRRRQRKPAIA